MIYEEFLPDNLTTDAHQDSQTTALM